MDYVRIASFPSRQDLSALLGYLLQQGINHELVEDREGQHLFVESASAANVQNLLSRLSRGGGVTAAETAALRPGSRFFEIWPISFALVILGGIGYMAYALEWVAALQALTFTQFDFTQYALYPKDFGVTYLHHGQWWRLLTPAFLHFSLLHFVFNSLAVWELGRRLEVGIGSHRYAVAFLVLAILANVAQYALTGPSLFGGLSGAVFGFVGMIFPLHRRTRHPIFALPPGLYGLVLATLVLGFSGLFGFFNLNLANGAHAGGLVAGLALGALWPRAWLTVQPGATK